MSKQSAPLRCVLLVALCAIGCSSGSFSARSTLVEPPIAPESHWLAGAEAPFLYVGGYLTLSEYAYGSSKPLRSIEPSIGNADALALDDSGNLFVANGDPSFGQIAVYEAGTLTLLRTINSASPQALALDRLGYLYVANGGGGIAVYTPGGTQLVGYIRSHLEEGIALAFERSGDLYVANELGSITVYGPAKRPGKMTFLRKITDGIKAPDALVFGPSGQLFVANRPAHGRGSVSIYSGGSSSPQRILTDDVKAPQALAVDRTGRLYVANAPYGRIAGQSHGWVTVYAARGKGLLRKITDGIDFPYALAIDPSDKLYVANIQNHSVTVYSPGGARLLRRITKGAAGAGSLLFSSHL